MKSSSEEGASMKSSSSNAAGVMGMTVIFLYMHVFRGDSARCETIAVRRSNLFVMLEFHAVMSSQHCNSAMR